MAKQKAKRRKPAKKKTELAKRDKPKGSEVLKTITRNGKEVNVERRDITNISSLPALIAGSDGLADDQKLLLEIKLEALRVAIRSDSKNLQDEAIGEILGDLVIGAYQDRLVAYGITLKEANQVNAEKCHDIMKVRQSADAHLLNIIKAVRDIKRPPVSVVVKEAQQVNVAEQINQADKQVNIAENQQS